jgi:hypothetical protein
MASKKITPKSKEDKSLKLYQTEVDAILVSEEDENETLESISEIINNFIEDNFYDDNNEEFVSIDLELKPIKFEKRKENNILDKKILKLKGVIMLLSQNEKNAKTLIEALFDVNDECGAYMDAEIKIASMNIKIAKKNLTEEKDEKPKSNK